MKNQGAFIIRIVALVIGIFIVVYMGFHIISAFNAPARTITAVLLRTEETFAFNGIILRNEEPVNMPAGLLEYRLAEGEQASKDQVIAQTYANSSAFQTNSEISLLEERLKQLEAIENRQSSGVSAVSIDEEIYDSLINFTDNAGRGEAYEALVNGKVFKSAVFRREYAFNDTAPITSMIEELNYTIAAMKQSVTGVTGSVRAPRAGLFSRVDDGLYISYDDIPDKASLEALLKEDYPPLPGNRAKLVYGLSYKLLTVLDEESVLLLGKSAEMRIAGLGTKTMGVSYISEIEDGGHVVAFESSEGLSGLTAARKLSGEIILDKNEGVRVPKEAVRSDEEGTFVYCLVLSQIIRKPIDIVLSVERENYFLVRYQPGNTKNLLPGDEMIIAGKDLYDGKIIR